MSESIYGSTEHLPNLPGFRLLKNAANQSSAKRVKMFRIVDGIVFPKDLQLPNIETNGGEFNGEQSIMALGNGGTTSLISRPQSNALIVKNVNIVLNFFAHFIQRSPNGSIQSEGLTRNVNIYFYVEDGTMSIVERPHSNSGVQQGTLCSRAVVWKSDGYPVAEDDFTIGGKLEIFGQTYSITSCDQSTRRHYLRNPGQNSSFQNTVNESTLSQMQLSAAMMRSDFDQSSYGNSGSMPRDKMQWDQYRSKKNEDKLFMEAKLGNTVNNSGRDGFMRYGNKTLKFRCLWDNTSMLYGDVVEFSLLYFLADDTVEIFSAANASNCSKEQFSRLLHRSKLPKKYDYQSIGNHTNKAMDEDYHYHWSDLYIDMVMDVYGRSLRVIDADDATRSYYADCNIPLSARVERKYEPVPVVEREVPPSTGFGSEEDSLRSCHGPLQPGAPRIKKLGENSNLTFLCTLESGGPDAAHRRFVLTYYLQDRTVKVEEKPIRNSGFVGGVFLSRRVIQNSEGELLTERQLYVGSLLGVFKHEFRLLETDEVTLRWMEDKGLPQSSFTTIIKMLRSDDTLMHDAENGNLALAFQSMGTRPDCLVTRDMLLEVLRTYCPLGPRMRPLYEHEMITIIRTIGDQKDSVNYRHFIQQIISPTSNQ